VVRALTEIIPLRLLALPALLLAALVDGFMRPDTPDDQVPTPLEIIQRSKSWRVFLGAYSLGTVATAILSATVSTVGAHLAQNPWLLFSAILIPVAGPILQHQIALFRALGDRSQH
jgi:hypothetical protein